MKKTINMTFKMDATQVNNFENWFRQQEEVIDFKILPNTEKLYEDDKHFQEIVKKVKAAQKVRDEYINLHNH
jgi:ribosomal protein S6